MELRIFRPTSGYEALSHSRGHTRPHIIKQSKNSTIGQKGFYQNIASHLREGEVFVADDVEYDALRARTHATANRNKGEGKKQNN